MITITATHELDVLDKYTSLLGVSMGVDGVYIRTKETLNELLAGGSLKETDRAKVIADVLTGLNASLVSASMSTALTWSSTEKKTELDMLTLSRTLDNLDKDGLQRDATLNKTRAENYAVQAQSVRQNGVATISNGIVTSLTATGKVYEEIQLITQKTTNAASENTLLASKLIESQAAAHKVIADTYANYGHYTYTTASTGVTNVVAQHTHTPLSKTQQSIAQEQAKGYAYNAWANAMTGSAGILGTMLAGGLTSMDEGGTGAQLLASINSIADSLGSVTAPSW